jgi:hemolysin activation/secretion protein
MAAGPDTIPNQILADPAGRSGVRGYPHRSIIGAHAMLLRLDYHIERDLFVLARVPLLKKLRLQLVPFLDVGAAWTPGVNRRLTDATLPLSRDWKWGVGIGVRKGLGFGELLSHCRFDTAWRLDRGRASPVVYFVLETESFD